MVRKAEKIIRGSMKKRGLWPVVLVVILFWSFVVVFAQVVFAQDYFEEEDLLQVAVRKVLDFDNMVILPTTKTVRIRTIEKSLDVDGNVVSQKAGRKFIYMDVGDNEETLDIDETRTDFTDFMQLLNISKAKVKNAIRTMEQD